MDLIYLIKSLLRKKWLIIISTILAVLLAFVLTMNEKRLYRSVAQLATGFTTTDKVKLTDEGFNIYEIDVKFNNVTEAFKSSKVLSMLSYSVMLHDL
jgi:polysaccharide biosynthesis transport protein